MQRIIVILLAILYISLQEKIFIQQDELPPGNLATVIETFYSKLIGVTNIEHDSRMPLFFTPPGIARATAIVQSCMYDAWAIFQKSASPYLAKGVGKVAVNSTMEMYQTISVASYLCISEVFRYVNGAQRIIDNFFCNILNINGASLSAKLLAKHVAKAIISFYRNDGFNSEGFKLFWKPSLISFLGDEPGTQEPAYPFRDYTNYKPVNPPSTTLNKATCSRIRDINHWQQLLVRLDDGSKINREFYTAQAGIAKTFALKSPFQFVPPAPPQIGSNNEREFLLENIELIRLSGMIGDREKCIVSYCK